MIHGISQGYDAFLNPEILWEHFSKVKALEIKYGWVHLERWLPIQKNEKNSLECARKRKRL